MFKVRAATRATDSGLQGRNLQVLGETRDWVYFVLSSDDGAGLLGALDEYVATSEHKSLLDIVERIEPYGPTDRRGPGLDSIDTTSPFRVDIRIWPAGNRDEARRRAVIVQTILDRGGAQVELRAPHPRRNLIRAVISAAVLDALLDTSVVEQVRTPPVPFLDFRDWFSVGADDLQRVELPSAEVGILDDAPASAHPLLTGLVTSIDPVEPPEGSYVWQQPGHHGTEVVGRALFPGLHEQLRDGTALEAHGTVRVARILEPDPDRPDNPPRFARSRFPHELIETGIRELHRRYGVRVFNLSAGYAEPADQVHLGELSETIDELVRELDIVVVVPTGNSGTSLDGRTDSGHHIAEDYPHYLHSAHNRVAEPGPAALAVTVGSVALSDAVAERDPPRFGWQAIAGIDQISPFSRTGPGVGVKPERRNKPEFVHYGGNSVLNDVGQVVPNDMGASIVSTALRPSRLFAACNGTSYATPVVARVAADILHAYPDASANLIRALLVLSARLPEPAANVLDDHRRAALYGWGIPNSRRAIESGQRRATLIYQGSIDRDTVHLHSVPVPEVFRLGGGTARTISVALAFDPPVRRQRREYLAAEMTTDLYRNIDPEELRANLIKQQRGSAQDPITDRRRRPPLQPGSSYLASSAVHARTWTATRSFIDDSEWFQLAVTHRAATWAPDNYTEQRYALAITLEDQQLQQADLHQLLTNQLQLRLPTRIELRGQR